MSAFALSSTRRAEPAGFYGKLPAVGDFVVRRASRDWVEAWDGWMQDCLATSRDQLGADWLPAYLNCPIWNFTLAAGVCGTAAAAGVLMPSVDRVGRYFPLAIVALLPAGVPPLGCALEEDSWFEQAGGLALGSLEGPFDLDRFDRAVEELPPLRPAAPAVLRPGRHGGRLVIGSDARPAAAIAAFAATSLDRSFTTGSLWWSAGSAEMEPSLLVAPGLPPAGAFAALLTGDWVRYGWQEGGEAA